MNTFGLVEIMFGTFGLFPSIKLGT